MTTAESTVTPRPLSSVPVGAAMTTGVIHCRPDAPLRAVARLMAQRHVHAVFVFDYGVEDDETVSLWGLVSDLDLVAAARGNLAHRTAGQMAVTPLVTVDSDDSLERASRLMAEHGTAHLAVLDPVSGRPVGVISTLDLARVVGGVEPAPAAA